MVANTPAQTESTSRSAFGRGSRRQENQRRLPTLASIARCASAVDRLKQRSLRNACEHTEDRALGNVRESHPQALTVFDHEPRLAEDTPVYGKFRLGVTDELPGLLADMRQCIKDVVSGRGGTAAVRV